MEKDKIQIRVTIVIWTSLNCFLRRLKGLDLLEESPQIKTILDQSSWSLVEINRSRRILEEHSIRIKEDFVYLKERITLKIGID